jgi:hypothetical protein
MTPPLRPRFLLLALTAVLALALLGPRPAAAQGARRPPFEEDTHAFRRILFDFNLTPLESPGQQADSDPADTIIVILGETGWIGAQGDLWLAPFVAKGGALLFATDRPLGGGAERELLAVAGVTVADDSFRCQIPTLCYRALSYCPILLPFRNAQPPLFRGPGKGEAARLVVATNLPSHLRRPRPLPGNVRELAALPPRDAMLKFGRLEVNSPPLLFAVGGEYGAGKVLVLADHSIFINQMMLPTDNVNVEFTYNCLDWLRTKPGGRRSKVLLMEDGHVRTDLNVPLKNVRINPEQLPGLLYEHRNELAAGVEQELARLEGRNALNRGLMGFLTEQGFTVDDLERLAVVLLSILLVGFVGFRLLTRGRHRAEPAVLPLVSAVAQHVPTAPLLEQRHRALLRGGNVWEAARGVARQWFAAAGAPAGEAAPRVVVEGGWWERWVMRRRVRRLWRLAYGPRPVRVSLRALRRLFGELEELSVAQANGALRFEA